MKLLSFFLFIFSFFSGPILAQTQEELTLHDEHIPVFYGGSEAMYQFIESRIRYPKKALKNNISGEVITQFILDTAGYMKDIRVVKGIGYGCDEEMVRVLTLMDKEKLWTPGMKDGHPVSVTFTIPVMFGL